MHLKSKEGIITEVHLEKWDDASLPAEIKSSLLALEGQDESLAISMLFSERTFLYTKHCFLLRTQPEPSLVLWMKSSLHGDDIDMLMKMMVTTGGKSALFVRESYETNPDSVFMVAEKALSPYKLQPETVVVATDADLINKKDKAALDNFAIFNLARNSTNEVINYNAKTTEIVRAKYTKNCTVIYAEPSGVIRIKQPTYLLGMSDAEIKSKIASVFLLTEDNGKAELDALAERLSKILSNPESGQSKRKKILGIF